MHLAALMLAGAVFFGSDDMHGLPVGDASAKTERAPALMPGMKVESRISFGIRGGLSLPENDLQLTTGNIPGFVVGGYGEYLLGVRHQLRPIGEWWYFNDGHQNSLSSTRTQSLDTRVRAVVVGGEYLCRLGGPIRRVSFGGGLYLARWSVDSVNIVTFSPGGTAQASGTSHWNRLAEGITANYRLSRRFEFESRWTHSDYGYEHLPVNVVTIGTGWRF